jgi:hypothetical protein
LLTQGCRCAPTAGLNWRTPSAFVFSAAISTDKKPQNRPNNQYELFMLFVPRCGKLKRISIPAHYYQGLLCPKSASIALHH